MTNEIAFTKVKLPYGWLGNMSPYPIMADGKIWRTTEALFQAMRFSKTEIKEEIRAATSPMAAKMIAKRNIGLMIVNPRTQDDVDNMRNVLQLKLQQHPDIKRMLLETGDAKIIEDCSARANASGLFWGATRCLPALSPDGSWWEGENMLGKLWMRLRDEARGIHE